MNFKTNFAKSLDKVEKAIQNFDNEAINSLRSPNKSDSHKMEIYELRNEVIQTAVKIKNFQNKSI